MRDLEEYHADNGSWGRCMRCGERTWIESGCAPLCTTCEEFSEPEEVAIPGPDAEPGEAQ